MSLTDEQKQQVAAWVAAGDNLSSIQKKLLEHLKISLTYRDVRFLVDDLNLSLIDAAPKLSTDLSKPDGAQPGAAPAGPGAHPDDADAPLEDEMAAAGDAGPSGVSVTVDKVTLIPGALAGGTVTFSDGVTGKWIVDNQGRPGLVDISKPNYRPSAADAQAFMQELSAALQKRGL